MYLISGAASWCAACVVPTSLSPSSLSSFYVALERERYIQYVQSTCTCTAYSARPSDRATYKKNTDGVTIWSDAYITVWCGVSLSCSYTTLGPGTGHDVNYCVSVCRAVLVCGCLIISCVVTQRTVRAVTNGMIRVHFEVLNHWTDWQVWYC